MVISSSSGALRLRVTISGALGSAQVPHWSGRHWRSSSRVVAQIARWSQALGVRAWSECHHSACRRSTGAACWLLAPFGRHTWQESRQSVHERPHRITAKWRVSDGLPLVLSVALKACCCQLDGLRYRTGCRGRASLFMSTPHCRQVLVYPWCSRSRSRLAVTTERDAESKPVSSNACPPASVSCLVKSILLARVCPGKKREKSTRHRTQSVMWNSPGPVGCPGSPPTLPYRLRGEASHSESCSDSFFARPPTASDNSTINQRVGRNSTRGRQQQTCYGGCRVGCGEMDGRKRQWSFSETRQWQELATCRWRRSYALDAPSVVTSWTSPGGRPPRGSSAAVLASARPFLPAFIASRIMCRPLGSTMVDHFSPSSLSWPSTEL